MGRVGGGITQAMLFVPASLYRLARCVRAAPSPARVLEERANSTASQQQYFDKSGEEIRDIAAYLQLAPTVHPRPHFLGCLRLDTRLDEDGDAQAELVPRGNA